MIRKTLLAAAAIALLAACGAPSDEKAKTETAAPAAAAATEATPEILAAVAALPAPYNEADYMAGRRVFGQCASCHTIEAGEAHRIGPNLHGLFGREIGAAEGFTYSQPLLDASFTWTPEQLDHWLENPREFLPGNRMAFMGVRNETQRRDVIAYVMVKSAD